MNKLGNIIVLSLLPIVSFAQRAERFDSGFQELGGPAALPDANPINQYEIALIIMAVSIIVYFVYRQYTAKRQA